MVGVGFLESLIMALLLLGGSANLEDFLDVEGYWSGQGVEITVENMLEELTAPAPAGDEMVLWVEQLGAASFDEREAAEAKLRNAGHGVKALLGKAMRSSDPEIRMRARRILDLLPEKMPGQDHLRARLALITLSRMEEEEAKQQFVRFSKQEGPLSDMARQMLAYRVPRQREDEDRFALVSGQSIAVARFQRIIQNEDSAVVRELRASPGIQSGLLKMWQLTGHVRIREATASFSFSNAAMPPEGEGCFVIKGQFEPGKIHALLKDSRFTPDEQHEFWKGKQLVIRVAPDGTQISGFVRGPGEDPSAKDLTSVLEKGGSSLPQHTRQFFPAVPDALVQVGFPIPEAMPLIPGIQAQPESVSFQMGRNGGDLNLKWVLLFGQEEDANGMQEFLQGEIDSSKKMLAEEDLLEVAVFVDLLDGIRLAAEGRQVQVSMEVSEDLQVRLIRTVEQWMSMMRGIQNHHPDLQVIQ
jgi:hypothetical protein